MAQMFDKTSLKEYPVVEIFKSIEGEGIRTGSPTVFVRFAYCNLKCSYCDTKYAQSFDEATYMSREEIATKILSLNCKRVTFTGGEPLERGENFIRWFIKNFPDHGVNIETNGSKDVSKYCTEYSDVIVTMDYKCPSSKMCDKMMISNLEKLTSIDVLKFVVADSNDLKEVVRVLMEHKPRCHIYVSPVLGKMDFETLAKFVVEHDFLGIRMGLQIHKFIWSPDKRGV